MTTAPHRPVSPARAAAVLGKPATVTQIPAPLAPEQAGQLIDARRMAIWAFICSAFGAFFALLAAVFAGYTAYVVYRILQAISEAVQGV